MVIKVYAVHTLVSIDIRQSNAITEAFSIDNSEIEELAALKNAIYANSTFINKFGNDLKPHETWFCFGRSGNFICTLPELNEKEHKIVVPGKYEHVDIQKFEDKLQALKQMSYYDIDGIAKFSWPELLLPQVVDIAEEYVESAKADKGNKGKLKGKLAKSAKFIEKFGKKAIDKLEFRFKNENPLSCMEITIRSPPQHATDTSDNEGSDVITRKIVDSTKDKDTVIAGKNQDENSEHEGDKEISIDFMQLSDSQFTSLLDVFELVGSQSANWNIHWNTLQCSKYFLKHFGDCEAEDLVVIVKNDEILNVVSKDGTCTLNKNKCIYPCVECSKEVTDKLDSTGEGLSCSKCSRYFHNRCMTTPVSKELFKALAKSPDYIQIFCPGCMNMQGTVDKISTDMETMKKEMTWAARVNNGLVQGVEKAVVSMEKSTKSSTGLIKILPKRVATQNTEEMKKTREEKMSRTAVIVQPKLKANNSYGIRKEFNKTFPNIALRSALATANGSIKIEFDTTENRDDVIGKWDTTLFNGNSGIRKSMLNLSIGIVKRIDTDENTEDIEEDIKIAYPGSTVDFFKKNQKFTGTVKLIFKDQESYMNAVKDGGINICGIKYRLEQYVPKPRVIRCYRCQSYGHISSMCRAKESRCGRCCQSGHESNNCTEKITTPVCFHCKGGHFTGSSICKDFKAVEEKIRPTNNYGF